jgi:hypothetical protein
VQVIPEGFNISNTALERGYRRIGSRMIVIDADKKYIDFRHVV